MKKAGAEKSKKPRARIGFSENEGGKRMSLTDAPVVDDINVPPREETRQVQDYKEEIEVKTVPVPHIEIREEFQEVPTYVKKQRYSKQPRMDVLHRKISIPKPVKQQKIVEMPQLHVVDRITEKFEDIYKEKIVEKPKYIIQERIVPVPKRQIEEITVRVPRDKFEAVVNTQLDSEVEEKERYEELPMDDAPEEPKHEPLQGPKYRHIPRPVETPMIHYRPCPVERLVERNVPIPVELHVVQEFQCPVLVPQWTEAPVPVHVTRVIEKPVPADALSNKLLLGMYMQQTQHIDRWAEDRATNKGSLFSCLKKQSSFPVMNKMSDEQTKAAGLNVNLMNLKTMNSRAFHMDQKMLNASVSQGFLTQARTMAKERTEQQIYEDNA